MPKVFTSKTQKIGEIGENLAIKFLMKHGFTILDRNYTKKWGEIDIVAEKESKIHFVEVKSVSRTIQTYLLSQNIPEEKEWQMDLLIVFLNLRDKKAKIEVVKDIVL